MKLTITDHNGVIDTDFAKWLLDRIQIECLRLLNEQKLQKWSEYLTKSKNIPRLYNNVKYDAADILIDGINNLRFRFTSPNSFDIYINPNINIKGYKEFNLLAACKMINYGNRDVQGIPIFTSVFEDTTHRIPQYIYYYYGV